MTDVSGETVLKLLRLRRLRSTRRDRHLGKTRQKPKDDGDAEDDGAGPLQKKPRTLEHLRPDLAERREPVGRQLHQENRGFTA